MSCIKMSITTFYGMQAGENQPIRLFPASLVSAWVLSLPPTSSVEAEETEKYL